ncbi:plasmid mobilization protein [Pseudomonas monsensis]
METEHKHTPRRNLPPIKVCLSAEERVAIENGAQQANMSLSAYLLELE